jgi:hypothetical protein
VVSRARKTLRVSTTATIAQIPAVSLKEGAVIGWQTSIESQFFAEYWCWRMRIVRFGALGV